MYVTVSLFSGTSGNSIKDGDVINVNEEIPYGGFLFNNMLLSFSTYHESYDPRTDQYIFSGKHLLPA